MKNTFPNEIVFEELTRTAVEAATALKCEVGQIAKSIVFKTEDEVPILVIASGVNRVNEQMVEEKLGKKIFKADAEFVKDKTGMVIGGVAPWGHKEKIETLIDEDLGKYQRVWASSGKNNAVFPTTIEEIVKMTGGEVVKIS